MSRFTPAQTIALAVFSTALLLGGCAAPGASPTVPPTPTPAPATEVTSPAQAAALVFASDAGFARMQPPRADVIGQSAWFDASEDATGFSVTITLGAGDCQAGCIERHTWSYHVDRDGTVTLVGDEGDDITFDSSPPTGDSVMLQALLLAGPLCPVEQNPPNPECAPRAVANAAVLIFDADGRQVADVTSDAQGSISVQLPAGAYDVVPAPVEGLLGTAAAQAFAAVGGDLVDLVLSYDTGIR